MNALCDKSPVTVRVVCLKPQVMDSMMRIFQHRIDMELRLRGGGYLEWQNILHYYWLTLSCFSRCRWGVIDIFLSIFYAHKWSPECLCMFVYTSLMLVHWSQSKIKSSVSKWEKFVGLLCGKVHSMQASSCFLQPQAKTWHMSEICQLCTMRQEETDKNYQQ